MSHRKRIMKVILQTFFYITKDTVTLTKEDIEMSVSV